ncbi:Glycosyltransferase [plant metagenome]|uniref:Glycosyltransferase n=1 Tax=plant metagenome TaxID=1297885 RepID=A0A484QAM7_9ZZZZ
MNSIRIALYGDLNLNYVDGSAIWAVSLVEALSGLPDVRVSFFLKAAVTKQEVIRPILEIPNVDIIPPPEGEKMLSPAAALDAIAAKESGAPFDAVVLRGFALCKQAARRPSLAGRLWTYLTDIPHEEQSLGEEDRQEIRAIIQASRHVLCQTRQFADYFTSIFPESRGKLNLLPPMIPAFETKTSPREARPDGVLQICYAGKFAPLWASREMLRAFATLRKLQGKTTELHVFGDKIHNPPEDPSFKPDIQAGLRKTPGVVWHGRTTREDVLRQLPSMSLGWAWRPAALEDHTLEISTKFLEYGLSGLPVLLNANAVVRDVLGEDYPLFARTEDQAQALLVDAAKNPELLKLAAERCQDVAGRYTIDAIRRDHLAKLIEPAPKPLSITLPRARKPRLLVAGHDLKFADALLKRLESHFEVDRNYWWGHAHHDVRLSEDSHRDADVVFCEWCLPNAVWHTTQPRDIKPVVVRFHRQELYTDHPRKLDMRYVRRMIFVGEETRRAAIEKFQWQDHADKLVVIPNYVDTATFDLPKTPDAPFNIGIAGVVPSMKRLDLALDVLETLRNADPRFRLFVKGRRPQEYPWFRQGRQGEAQYYLRLLQRIKDTPLLQDAVTFDGWGSDMGDWYRKIGAVLSVSDYESFHLAIAEGAASGAIPIVRDWHGAEEIYPGQWICGSIQQMADRILETANDPDTAGQRAKIKHHIRQSFDIGHVEQRYIRVLEDL